MYKYILVIALLMMTGKPASAAECRYFDRADSETFLSALAPEIVGVVKCSPQITDVNQLLVAKLPLLSKDAVKNFVMKIAHVIDTGVDQVTIVGESQTERGPYQVVVRSMSARQSNGEIIAMDHFAFVVNQRLFIHSIDSGAMKAAKPSLESIKHIVAQMKIKD